MSPSKGTRTHGFYNPRKKSVSSRLGTARVIQNFVSIDVGEFWDEHWKAI
ncbi:hypothetical protein LEP1GSC103_3323 [Leptospira borgpetersenii serovar Javanica str. UI 09931]|uniref:Uncharacterized protein n=4 Tax=Leptospira borgpetersenii TaxID=174 RepID=M3HM29_LEPBO|nr:hypothetical protein LEP1GSC128_2751 [Leptospira borgpetersenii str. 200801926]EKQ90625.1 hypothetical protein LEP1GSC101_0341 [Leptospira borgpetersenii str. UI 09149]EMF98719.1 hypothetical protein LEP1GSC123_2934 [Leptospira borgpetersenii str. 200701203]EMK12569.1 hypothetical protein LEP1GSC066_2996 [Leptospira sp. serovar Kenya str. Sh9]EMN17997.1 hypothetical protein LEP1GSC056_0439 [Leptospira borgpetersenii str. Brem 328]EMN57584.1 hypothetical protein LEP1GSC090_0926 [Leptospira b